jgi:hypothetical protein
LTNKMAPALRKVYDQVRLGITFKEQRADLWHVITNIAFKELTQGLSKFC